jgi:hypothetical protein
MKHILTLQLDKVINISVALSFSLDFLMKMVVQLVGSDVWISFNQERLGPIVPCLFMRVGGN